jgi:hypothetical protein
MLGEIIKRAFWISSSLAIIYIFYLTESPNVDRLAGIGVGIVWLCCALLLDRDSRPFRLPHGWPNWIALAIPGIYVAWVALRTNWLAPARKDLTNMVLCLVAIAPYAQPLLSRFKR